MAAKHGSASRRVPIREPPRPHVRSHRPHPLHRLWQQDIALLAAQHEQGKCAMTEQCPQVGLRPAARRCACPTAAASARRRQAHTSAGHRAILLRLQRQWRQHPAQVSDAGLYVRQRRINRDEAPHERRRRRRSPARCCSAPPRATAPAAPPPGPSRATRRSWCLSRSRRANAALRIRQAHRAGMPPARSAPRRVTARVPPPGTIGAITRRPEPTAPARPWKSPPVRTRPGRQSNVARTDAPSCHSRTTSVSPSHAVMR